MVRMPDRDVFPFLRLPEELQLDVFDCLAFDTGTLHSVILVNEIWYERAVGLLWSSPPDLLRALSQIERSRRPRYADLICTLILTRSYVQLEPSVMSSDAFVDFMQSCRHLRSITISQNTSKTPTTCIPTFLPTKDIEQTRCIAQNLEELVFYDFARVRSRESEFSPSKHPIWRKSNHFLRFIQQCTSLKKLILGSTVDLLVSAKGSAFSAGLQSSSIIRTHRLLDRAFIRSILCLTSARPLFHDIRDMALCIKAQAFALFTPSIIAVTRLRLRIDDPSNKICELLSQLPCLTQLMLKFLTAKRFSRNELAFLAKL